MNESTGWRVARVEPPLGSKKLEGGPGELGHQNNHHWTIFADWVGKLFNTTSKCVAPQ